MAYLYILTVALASQNKQIHTLRMKMNLLLVLVLKNLLEIIDIGHLKGDKLK